jgi:hypothetical protein
VPQHRSVQLNYTLTRLGTCFDNQRLRRGWEYSTGIIPIPGDGLPKDFLDLPRPSMDVWFWLALQMA